MLGVDSRAGRELYAKRDTETVLQMAWRIRLRGPQGTPAELELPAGGDTTLHELRVLAGKATRVAVHLLVLRAGFPPKPIAFDASTKTAKVSGSCETQCHAIPSAPR